MEPEWEVRPIPRSESALYAALPSYVEHGLAQFGPDRTVYSADVLPLLRRCRETPLHADDLWVLTQPKCGTNWAMEMAWLIGHDCDPETARSSLIPDRAHFLDAPVIFSPAGRLAAEQGASDARRRMLAPIQSRPTPWHVQSHLALRFCPSGLLDTCKVIYVTRNPKDACVSYYNMLLLNRTLNPDTTVNEFASLYMDGKMINMPFFPHVLEAWRQRHHPNLLFLTFEEMKLNLRDVIGRTATFLGKTLTTEQVDQLEDHLSFESMRNNKWVNKENMGLRRQGPGGETVGFMRKGQIGDWKNHLSAEVSQKMDRWMEENLEGTGLELLTESPAEDA